jgi:hypothetical protein
MLMAKATPMSEAMEMPKPELMAAIGKASENLSKQGMLVGTGALMPTSFGGRFRLSGGKITITDGPFAEIKEVLAGYAIVEVKSKEEAVELSRQFVQMHADIMGPAFEFETEFRQMYPEHGQPK